MVPGQPLSWNQAYRIGSRQRQGERGQLRLDDMGKPVSFRKIIKTDEAVAYTGAVAMIARAACPTGWQPSGLVVVEVRLFLGRIIDSDNVLKLLGDGIQEGTGIDDKWFLPRVMHKEWGLRPSERRVEVTLIG